MMMMLITECEREVYKKGREKEREELSEEKESEKKEVR